MSSKFDFSKFLFYAVCIVTVLGLFFAFGLYSGAKKTAVYTAVKRIKTAVKDTSEESSTILKIRPDHFLQPARFRGEGVTVNSVHDREEQLILLSGFFKNMHELRLIRRNGDVVARWTAQFSKIFPKPTHMDQPPKTDWNIDTHGALILPDGSVVFNFDYGGLVKLDRCGAVVWTVAQMSHHSVERAEGGGFWVPGRRYYPKEFGLPFMPFVTPLYDDTIMKVSNEGKILAEISISELFFDNDMESLLTATGSDDFKAKKEEGVSEIVHLNKIEELMSNMAGDFPMFDVGDLMLSLRNRNMIIIIDPDTGKIKWWRIGPWIRQHDPEFVPGGKIIVFNNNNYRTAFNHRGDTTPIHPPRYSNIIEFDFASDRHKIIYGNKRGQEMHTILRGKVQPTSTGGLLITEFEGGRVFETDAEGRVIWEYINRYSPDDVAEVSESRIYPASYFHVPDWKCERNSGQ